jgi:hypothetical protein
MRIEWRELIGRCPELAELADDARSIAEQERTVWYERWLRGSTIFAEATRAAAERLGVDVAEIRPVALAGLVDAYRRAKRRLRPAAPCYGKTRTPAAVT